jgi:hypothetical protein
MPTEPGSSVPRRQLGRHLRILREDAQVSVKLAAEQLEWSTPKIWRIESGATSLRALDVEAMCRLYGAPAETTAALMGLARESKARGWWHAYGDAIPAWFELYVSLETAASHLRQYGPELIPGLLQTAAYATEVFVLHHPDMPSEEVARGVAVRLERQKLLTRARPPAPRLAAVLSEAVLRRPLRDRAAMTEQFRHLLRVGRLPNVSIRVLPLRAGLHPGAVAGGSFTILDFPDLGLARGAEPTTVYSDGLTGALYLDKPDEIAAYEKVWASIVAATLDETQSMRLIAAIAKEHPTP